MTNAVARLHSVDEHHANLKAKKKARTHMECITFGIVISVLLTFVPSELAVHYSFVAAGAPSFAQEIIDYLREIVTEV